MRKNAAILMIIVLLCCSIFTENIYADICEKIYSINDNKDITHDFVLKEENAVEIYNEIIEIFTKNKRSIENYEKDIFRYSVDGLYAEDYPQYYSGAYINNSGDLVVMVKGAMTRSARKEIESISDKLDEIVFRSGVKYSFSDLIDTMTELDNYYKTEEYKKQDFLIYGFGIRDNLNKVVVYVNNVDEIVKERICENVTLKDVLIFELQEEYPVFTAGSGEGITHTNADGESIIISIGYRAKFTNAAGNIQYGFVTCGHSFDGITTRRPVYYNGAQIGTLEPTKNRNSGRVDAAFIKLSNSSTITNRIGTTNKFISGVAKVQPQGSRVYMHGWYTNGSNIANGLVEDSSFGYTNGNGISYTDVVKAKYASVEGDSGGLVYATVGSMNYVVGVQSAGFQAEFSIYSKVGNINGVLGLQLR